MRHRCARRRRCGTRVVRIHTIDAKLAESIHSNLTNGDAVPDLGVRGDTTDKALGVRKQAADAYRGKFVGDGSTDEVKRASGIAEVNVIEASDRGLSCVKTHGCVKKSVGIVQCCVTHRYVERATDVVKQRGSTHGLVLNATYVGNERRNADGVVITAINVSKERQNANCVVIEGSTGSIRVIIRERGITNGGV